MGILASFHHLHSLPPASPIGVPMDFVLVPVWTRTQWSPLRGTKSFLTSLWTPSREVWASATCLCSSSVSCKFLRCFCASLETWACSSLTSCLFLWFSASSVLIWDHGGSAKGPSSFDYSCLFSHILPLGVVHIQGTSVLGRRLGIQLSYSTDIHPGLLLV